MTRKKVKLAWIANNSARRASLKKRRLGLVKKVSELTTLCGIEACIIIYSPDENEPVVWPSHAEVRRLLGMFYSMPELERMKKMTNLETYLKEKDTKSLEQLTKQQRKNKEVEVGRFMHQIDQGKVLHDFNIIELRGVTWFVEDKMTEIRKRIDFFKQVPLSPEGPAHGDLPLPPQSPVGHDLTAQIGGSNAELGGDARIIADSLLWDQWFNDMTSHEFKSGASSSNIRSDTGLPYYNPFVGIPADDLGLPGPSFGGSSSVAADLGLPRPFGGSSSVAADLGLPRPSFGGSSSVAGDLRLPRPAFGGSSSVATDLGLPSYANFSGPTTDTGLPHDGSVGGSNVGPFRSDMGPGLHPFGHVGGSSTGSELGGQAFGFFGGDGSGDAAGSGRE